MAQKDIFDRLGAPLANVRWSWGSVRKDGIVFLRVWQDEIRKHDGALYVRITKHKRFASALSNPGYQERLRHIELLKTGCARYLIMCQAVDVDAVPRQVKDFNADEIFIGGPVVELDDDSWIKLEGRVPVRQIAI